MHQKNESSYLLGKIKEFILCRIAFIFFLFFSLLLAGIKKVKAQFSINSGDPSQIYDPVHEPPQKEFIDSLSQKPLLIISVILALIFPFRIYQVLKKHLIIQFTFWRLIKNILKECYFWTLIFVFLISVQYFPDLNYIHPGLIFYMFIFLVLISGIETLFFSLKDRRFLKTAIFLILFSFPAITLGIEVVLNLDENINYLNILFLINFIFSKLSPSLSGFMILFSPIFILIELSLFLKNKNNFHTGQKKTILIVFTILSLMVFYTLFTESVFLIFSAILIGVVFFLARSISK